MKLPPPSQKLPFRQALAGICHSIWAGNMRDLLFKYKDIDGSAVIPPESAAQIRQQTCTSFEHLSAIEQEAFLKEADKFLFMHANYVLDHKFPPNKDLHTVVALISSKGEVIHPDLDPEGFIKVKAWNSGV